MLLNMCSYCLKNNIKCEDSQELKFSMLNEFFLIAH